MRIDAHQHFWRLGRGDYDWPTADQPLLYRDFEPADLSPLLVAHEIDKTILVQATPTDAETLFLLDFATRHSWIEGVVGWLDLSACDAPERIAGFASTALRGLRPMLQDLTERNWIERAELAPALSAMARHSLVLDALIRPDQIASICWLADRHPDLAIVIDHAAKPVLSSPTGDWRMAMSRVATRKNVWVKLSGLLTEVPAGTDRGAILPIVETLLDLFGPERLVWGSDWPVVTTACSYKEWVEISEDLLAGLAPHERAAIFGENAQHLYGLKI